MSRVFALFVLAGVSVAAPSASAEVVRLEDLERKLLAERPAEADDARVRATAADVRKAASAYHPQVGFEYEATASPGGQLLEIPERPWEEDPAERGDTYYVSGSRKLDDANAFEPVIRQGADIKANAMLYDFGRTKAAVAAGKAAEDAARAGAGVTREAAVRRLRDAYFGWLIASEEEQLKRLARDEASRRLARVRGLISENVRARADLSPAESEQLLAELELTRAQGKRADALLVLEHLIRARLPAGAEPDRTLLDREPPTPKESPAAGERALTLQREAAYAMARAAEKERRPVIGVGGSIGLRTQWDVPFPVYGAGVNLTVPLWDGGLSKANAAGARARGEELDARLREQQREREFVEQRARATIAQLGEQLVVARALEDQCKKRLKETEEGYDVGAVAIEQVYQARAMLQRAESEVLMARSQRARAVLEMTPVGE
jgi:outer membrane protein TolC